MHDIALFVAGMLIILMAIPLIQSFTDTITMVLNIIVTFTQWIQSIFNLKTVSNNVKIQDLKDSIEPTMTQAVGFQVPSEDEFYDEEDPDENKFNSKNKNKVGF